MARDKPLDYVPIYPRIATSDKFRAMLRAYPKRKRAIKAALLDLFCYAAIYHPDGNLGIITGKDLKLICDWPGSGAQFLENMVRCEWLFRETSGDFLIKNWEKFGGKVLENRKKWQSQKQRQRRDSNNLQSSVQVDKGVDVRALSISSKGKGKSKSKTSLHLDTSSPPSGTQITDEKRQRLVSLRGFSNIKRDAVFTRVEVEAMMMDEGWHVQGYGGPKHEDNRLRLSNLGPQMGTRLIKAAGITRKGPNPNATYFITTLINLRQRALYPTPEQVKAPHYEPLYHECTPEELQNKRDKAKRERPQSIAGAPSRPKLTPDEQRDEDNLWNAGRRLFGLPDIVGGT